MAFDTKYRPTTFDDVLGQEGTVEVIKSFIRKGIGFHHSYLFAGPYGSGKTTLGRITARALLCENPTDGSPCDKCKSCVEILKGESINFIEVDAATNSGKDQIRKILEELQYATFSGKRRIYLFDESHQLSKDALDAMLKPMEDCIRGSEDKLLVCIFCTTEPEKMRTTILSRCAPAFLIRPMTSEEIAKRLAFVCEAESIEFDFEALPLIAEFCELHIRDALKAIEGVSMLGKIDRATSNKYLRLDANLHFSGILSNLKLNPKTSFELLTKVRDDMSPVACYKKLIELCMSSYHHYIGIPSKSIYWTSQDLSSLGDLYGISLVDFTHYLSSRPSRPTFSMLQCDLAYLHKLANPSIARVHVDSVQALPPTLESEKVGGDPKNLDGVWLHPKGVKQKKTNDQSPSSFELQPLDFLRQLKTRLEILERRSG